MNQISPDQSPTVFYFPCYHIQKCRSSKKVGRKDIILRFFFPSGSCLEKKTAWEIDCFFSMLFHIYLSYIQFLDWLHEKTKF